MRFLTKHKIKNKTVLLRVDFNVKNPKDSWRIKAALPTIKYLLQNKNKVVLLSHRGRPRANQAFKSRNSHLSLRPIAKELEKKLKKKINFLQDIPARLPEDKIIMLENLRFWAGEQQNSKAFAQSLAKLGDVYVNDAFSITHRKNASVVQLPKLLPSYAGFQLEKEILVLTRALRNPQKPFVLVFGGAKIKDKLPAVRKLMPKASAVLLGSSSLHKGVALPKSSKIKKPIDWLGGKMPYDIGPLTINLYSKIILKAKTIIWNGPVGLFEKREFSAGTLAIWKAILQNKRAKTIIGGGETIDSSRLVSNFQSQISNLRNIFISTGGGAMLDFLAGKKLPGIAALEGALQK